MEQTITKSLEWLGCRQIRQTAYNKISCTCPNECKHSDGRDNSPSYAVLFEPDSTPIGVCLACDLREPLLATVIRTTWQHNKQAEPLIRALHSLEKGKNAEIAHDKVSNFSARLERLRDRKYDDYTYVVNDTRETFYEIFTMEAVQYDVLPWAIYEPFSHSVPRYAMIRGLTLDTCRVWKLGHDRDRKRLLFPVRNINKDLVGVTGRLYDDNLMCPRHNKIVQEGKHFRCPVCNWLRPPKYLHSHSVNPNAFMGWRNKVLYGEHMLTPHRIGLLVEGTFDVLKLWQAGVKNPIASLGTHVGSTQIAKMKNWFDELWVWGDNDDAGRKMEQTVQREFSLAGGLTHILKLKPNDDPGDLSTDNILACLTANNFPL